MFQTITEFTYQDTCGVFLKTECAYKTLLRAGRHERHKFKDYWGVRTVNGILRFHFNIIKYKEYSDLALNTVGFDSFQGLPWIWFTDESICFLYLHDLTRSGANICLKLTP